MPATTKALREATPELATARPYAPDLTGWFDDFSHSGLYDALGGASRAGLYVNLFANVNGVLKPLLDRRRRPRRSSQGLSTGQRWRCPGAAERGGDLQADARLPVRRVPGAARQVRRALVILAPRRGAGARTWSSRAASATQRNDLLGRARQRVRPHPGRRPQGRGRARRARSPSIRLDKRTKHALVGFRIDKRGFGSLRRDVHCESRPQSLIGEYFLDCLPGTARAGAEARRADPGRADGLDDRARPRQRHPARALARAAADHRLRARRGRGRPRPELNAAIRRASPALRETDRVLTLLARPEHGRSRDLAVNADTVVGDLAANRKDVGRFVDEAGDTARASAERRPRSPRVCRSSPASSSSCEPTMKSLGEVADKQTPALQNLDASAPAGHELLRRLGPFAAASRPAIRSLGQASDHRRQAP